MSYEKSNGADDPKEMAWDLRQIYANDILGITLKKIKYVMDTADFPEWFRLLKRDLRVETNHKMSKDEREEIRKKIEYIKKIISNNEESYLGTNKTREGYQLIDDALCDLTMMFYNILEVHNMLGKPEGDEGLF